MLEHVKTCNDGRDGYETDGEDSERGHEFLDEIELRQRHDGQEPPQPLASVIFEFDLHDIPRICGFGDSNHL